MLNRERRRPRITGCVIAKDEERFLADCLQSLRAVCDEIIVVDTGSTDGTRALAEVLADKVANHPFTGDFSAARNHALGLVDESDWVLFLDADERLHGSQGQALIEAMASAEPDVGGVTLLRYNFFPTGGFYTGHELKAFRFDPGIRYERRINESVKGALARQGLRTIPSGALLTHIGHCRPRAERDAKARRYMDLMHQQLETDPNDAVLTGYIGLNLRVLGHFDEALSWSEKALSIDDANPTVWAFRGHVLRAAGRPEEARQAYEKGLAFRADDPALLNMTGVCEQAAGSLQAADEIFRRVLQLDPSMTHVLINRGLVAQARGDFATAHSLFQEAAKAFPPFLTEDPVGRLELDPLHTLYFETITGYSGIAHHIAYVRGCLEGWIAPMRVDCRVES